MAQSSNQFYDVMPGMANPGQSTNIGGGKGFGGFGAPGSSTGSPVYANPGQNPYQIPPQAAPTFGPTYDPSGTKNNPFGGSIVGAGGGNAIERPIDQGLTGQLFNYLQSQVGKGVSPFNLSTMLPTGGQTQQGQLTAGPNDILQQLMQFYQGGGSQMPGLNTLSQIATQGIDALPEWQKMIGAQQQNIQQNQANLREQFAGMGNLAGSPFGTAMSNYEQQTTLDQNALLAQLQQQNILQGQLPAIQSIMSGGQQFGGYMQGLDQQAIQNMYQEFIRTSPQYNPLLGYQYGAGTTFAPVVGKTSGSGILGALIPGLISGTAAGAGAAAGGAGIGGSILAGLAGI